MLVLLVACTDYNLKGQDKNTEVVETADTGTIDTAATTTTDTPVDTVTVTEPEDTAPVATEPVYLNTGSSLYSYDPTSNTATRIGDFKDGGTKLSTMTDTAIDLNGHMFGCAYAELYAIDPNTAAVTHVATMNGEFNSLTFLSDGRLIGAADGDVAYVDTSNGRTTPLVRNTGFVSSGDIVGLPDGKLYWSVENGGNDALVVVDPATAKATRLGDTGLTNLFGMGYAYGDLLGFSSAGTAAVLDTSNGRATSTTPLTGVWWGATTNPVLW
jgi:hypothetical protein